MMLGRWSFALAVLVSSRAIVEAEFFVGRIHEGQFEYDDLNGYMRPDEASELCDADPKCAGFTYRGLHPDVTKHLKKEQVYETFFFHFVPEIGIDFGHFASWTSYKTSKSYLTYSDYVFTDSRVDEDSTVSTLEECIHDPKCVGIVSNSNGFNQTLKSVNMDTAERVEGTTTFLNPNAFALLVEGENAYDAVDTCCPKDKLRLTLNKNKEKYKRQIKDDVVDRVSCDISKEEFYNKYVVFRKPVILTNCTNQWPAQKDWTLKSLLERHEDKIWRLTYLKKYGPRVKPRSREEFLSGRTVLDLMSANATVRVFQKLGIQAHEREKQRWDLVEDWTVPQAFPTDMYKKSIGGTDFQWVIMSHPETGSFLHTDPGFADAWNALLYGHKHWVLLPPDMRTTELNCDPACSDQHDEILTRPWFQHVLPQIRKLKWFGKKVVDVIQKPGETMYVPNGIPHAVLNLDENVSITENLLPESALGELARNVVLETEPFQFSHEWPDWPNIAWSNLYYRNLERENRRFIEAMREQVNMAVSFDA